jgi:hypothetical protein
MKGSRARREPGAGQELRGQYSLFTAEIATGRKEDATTDERGGKTETGPRENRGSRL